MSNKSDTPFVDIAVCIHAMSSEIVRSDGSPIVADETGIDTVTQIDNVSEHLLLYATYADRIIRIAFRAGAAQRANHRHVLKVQSFS